MLMSSRLIGRWLDWLRDGSEVSKLAARHRRAGVFEQRRMLHEAIELPPLASQKTPDSDG
jgi:hypothetical protein